MTHPIFSVNFTNTGLLTGYVEIDGEKPRSPPVSSARGGNGGKEIGEVRKEEEKRRREGGAPPEEKSKKSLISLLTPQSDGRSPDDWGFSFIYG